MSDAPALIKARPRRAAPVLLATESSVRWLIRSCTVLLFILATWIGVQLALDAPREPPVYTHGVTR